MQLRLAIEVTNKNNNNLPGLNEGHDSRVELALW